MKKLTRVIAKIGSGIIFVGLVVCVFVFFIAIGSIINPKPISRWILLLPAILGFILGFVEDIFER